jgi:4-hydroxythreonine-4-phosphate dehydrogenase
MTHAHPCELPLAVSMGDPCGIGPEIVAKAFVRGTLGPAVVVGDAGVMRRALQVIGHSCPVAVLASPLDMRAVPPGALPVFQPGGLPPGLAQLPWGQISAAGGAAAASCVTGAVGLVQSGVAAGLVTAPVHKEALHAAGIAYPGHTEMLQALCTPATGELPQVRMMLANDELRVVLVTIHVSLRRAIEQITTRNVLDTIRITHAAGRRFGMAAPRIAVAGLNPHAGEGGLFGDEEINIIAPAVQVARAKGMVVSGPFAPDTVFMRARNAPGHVGEFDFVIAMTHDHGLIPVKYLGVEQGVNVTLGLPMVRTSPDHGTAFDIAGQGVADASSLEAAARMAWQLIG